MRIPTGIRSRVVAPPLLPLGRQLSIVAALIFVLFSLVMFSRFQVTRSPVSDMAMRSQLERLIQAVPALDSARVVYGARDSSGHSMDTAKIIADPHYPAGGGYIAVYHSQWVGPRLIDPAGHFYVFVAFSKNLRDWQRATVLGGAASQPTITALRDGGFIVVWEQTDGAGHGNHFKVRYYATEHDLFTAAWSRQFDTPTPTHENLMRGATLSACAEGTPNIIAVTMNPDIDHAAIMLGGHYNANCVVDRQMTGLLTFTGSWRAAAARWQEARAANVDGALLAWLTRHDTVAHVGNIGDRDMAVIQGYRFGIFEAQYAKDDFGSFRCFLYDYQTGTAEPLTIVTHAHSPACGNPTLTRLVGPDGHPALVVTFYVFPQGAGKHESGELIYFCDYLPAAR